ncbi:GNAT family protein [Dethiobacter alkaliphilus]|uniref:hypothetical protein n=1 Tax=Dethiobacter alkaliphilus TaxID=427926 RepID=UPI002227E97B|nr:hypothetical protein [Dethiobacter alkaliphilus]MCW3490104.1 hypothetical protein [Dethiobacter alkaliphilus]
MPEARKARSFGFLSARFSVLLTLAASLSAKRYNFLAVKKKRPVGRFCWFLGKYMVRP